MPKSPSSKKLCKTNDYQILAVDDGSTDRTGEILEEMALLYPIRVFHHDFMHAMCWLQEETGLRNTILR